MKTAMQELMEILEAKILPFDDKNEYINGMNAANNNIIYYIKKEFLEKEKEQIIEAHSKGNEMVSGIFVYHDGEDYYNKIYTNE